LGAKAPINTVMIVRTPTRLEGGITDEERTKLEIHTKRWIDVAYQTGRTNRQKLVKAIEGLYRVAELKKPTVEIVPSPKAMVERFEAFALADNAIREATIAGIRAATLAATFDASLTATNVTIGDATDVATDSEVHIATHDATDVATRAATRAATRNAISHVTIGDVTGWQFCHQGGNMWAPHDCYITAFRDVLGLRLPEYEKYHFSEEAALYGGFRVVLPELCVVSDFPDILRVDSQWRPNCGDGPSHRWSDGWELWHLDGIQADEQLVLRPKTQTLQQIDGELNEDRKAIRIERYGWPEYLGASGAQLVDERQNFVEGTREALYRQRSGHLRLVVTCPTGRHPYALRVGDNHIVTCEQAQNWLAGEKPFRSLART